MKPNANGEWGGCHNSSTLEVGFSTPHVEGVLNSSGEGNYNSEVKLNSEFVSECVSVQLVDVSAIVSVKRCL